MSHSIGIDLGTSTSLIAVYRNDRPEVLRDIRQGSNGLLPSVVALGEMGELVVGEYAANRGDSAIREVKRDMGTSKTFELGGKEYRPQEISARILRHLKENAERILGVEVEEVIITVPAAFKDKERQATRDAGEIAGLRVERIINEPTAAALAYGLDRLDKHEHVLVYDLGGGTFDVSILEMMEGIFEVKSGAGDPQLGGKDFDARVIELIRDELQKEKGFELVSSDRRSFDKVRGMAERAKIDLSSQEATVIEIPFLGDEALDFRMVLNRREFEIATKDLVEKTKQSLDRALRDVKLDRSDVDEVILVGGSTRIPAVRDFVSTYFGNRSLPETVPPDEAVALGAAVQAAIKGGEVDSTSGMIVTDASPHSLGVAAVMLEGGMLLPDRFSVIIPRNSTVPVQKTERYSTITDAQTSVDIRVYQGELTDVSKVDPIKSFELGGIPPAPAGEEAIDISFSLDLNQELQVEATVVSTGESVEVRIEPDEARMTADERKQATSDLENQWKQSRFFNRVEPLIAAGERALRKADGDDAEQLKEVLDELKQALADEDEEAVDRLDEKLTDLLFALQ